VGACCARLGMLGGEFTKSHPSTAHQIQLRHNDLRLSLVLPTLSAMQNSVYALLGVRCVPMHAGHNGASQNTDPNLPTKAENELPGRTAAPRESTLVAEARDAAAGMKQQGNQWHAQGNYSAASKAYKEVGSVLLFFAMLAALP